MVLTSSLLFLTNGKKQAQGLSVARGHWTKQKGQDLKPSLCFQIPHLFGREGNTADLNSGHSLEITWELHKLLTPLSQVQTFRCHYLGVT